MDTVSNLKKLGIYIHIPFCLSKCRYCGFYSAEGKTEEEQADYVDSLIEDIEAYSHEYGDRYTVDTIFIGGGTPSILPAEMTERIMAAVREGFHVEEDAEITIESNPKTLTEEKLLSYRKAGINRLSMGLQSFDNDLLKNLGRVHSREDFLENYNLARRCGFDNINIDIMFSIPGHTLEKWRETLEAVTELSPEHISFYSLQIEEGTPLYEDFMEGKMEEIPDSVDREMYHEAIRILKEKGYVHYEISNACKEGFQCRHNLKYWNMDDYLGIGSNASSFMEGVRFSEAPSMEFHVNDFFDNVSEYAFTALRKTEGIDKSDFRERYGKDFWDVFPEVRKALKQYFDEGLITEDDEYIRLSEEGLDISNSIMAEFV